MKSRVDEAIEMNNKVTSDHWDDCWNDHWDDCWNDHWDDWVRE